MRIAVAAALCASARAEPANVSIAFDGLRRFLITIDQTVTDRNPHTTHATISIPRHVALIPADKFFSFHSHTRYANGDESSLKQPTTGFLLFGSDAQGATLEIRLVELYDKHDYVASEINGVYRIKYP